MTWVPAGAPSTRLGSTSDGIVASRYGSLAELAVLGRVEGPLEVIDAGRDDDPPTQPALGVVTVAGRAEPGQAAQGQADLRHGPRRPDVGGPPAHPGPDLDRVEQGGQDPLRIRAGHDDPCPDLLARGQPNAGGPAVGGRDRRDLGLGPDLASGGANGLRQRRRTGRRVRRGRRRSGRPLRRRCRRESVRKTAARPGRPRTHRGVVDAPGREDATERVGVERLGDEVGDGHRQDPQDRPGVALAEAAEPSPEAQAGQRVRRRPAT